MLLRTTAVVAALLAPSLATAQSTPDDRVVAPAVWWTCTARGRVEAGIWGNWDGYGRSQSAAQTHALTQCRRIASGCWIQSCRPGL